MGCGRIAGAGDHPGAGGPVRTHAQAYACHPRFRLAVAVQPDQDGLKRFQQAWGVPRGYASLDDVLERERLDVIDLCSPSNLHFSQAEQVLASPGRPRVLFVEKPVCLAPAELEQLTRLAADSGVGVFVNHTRRFDPAHRRVSELMLSGKLGAFLGGRGTYYGGWLNNGTHLIDTIRLIVGNELEVTSAVIASGGRNDDCNVDLRLRVGAGQVVVDAIDEAHYQLFESDFRFEYGRVQLLDAGSTVFVDQVEVNELGEHVLVPSLRLDGLRAPLSHAVEAIDTYLHGNDERRELGVDLPNAGLTMNIVWRALELADRRDAAHGGAVA